MSIDLQQLAGWISAATVVSTPLWLLFSKWQKLFMRLESLESWIQELQTDIEKSTEARRLLVRGTLACLKCLEQQESENAAVKSSIEELESFLLTEAHRTNSAGRQAA